MQERRFAVGDIIFSEGDASGNAYLIRAGRVEILKNSPKGQLCLAVLGPGDVLGEMGLLDERPRSATAKVSEAVVADSVERSEFLSLVLERPEEALGLLRALFERLRSVNQLLADMSMPGAAASQLPGVELHGLTPESEAVIGSGGVPITRFPFRFGRTPETRDEEALAFNDIEISDAAPYKVSLNHFSFDLGESGVVVRDRGSSQGTMVNGTRIGSGAPRDYAPLNPGENEVILAAVSSTFGAPQSPFRFKVVVTPA